MGKTKNASSSMQVGPNRLPCRRSECFISGLLSLTVKWWLNSDVRQTSVSRCFTWFRQAEVCRTYRQRLLSLYLWLFKERRINLPVDLDGLDSWRLFFP